MDFQTPSESFFKYIADNIRHVPAQLRLKAHGRNLDFDSDFAITQIECRQRGNHKLPRFMALGKSLFPSLLAYEQASHEAVADFHASLITRGSRLLDMTSGLGIDSLAFANHGCSVTACETDSLKAGLLAYNASLRGLGNRLSVVNADSTKVVDEADKGWDVIFADPARRSETDRRLYNLHDCSPDVLANLDILLSKCSMLLIKASPLLDITRTLLDIPSTRAIRTVSVAGECKETLVEAVPDGSLQLIEAIDLSPSGGINYRFSFLPDTVSKKPLYASSDDIAEGNYLYEPGAAVMKLAPWGELTDRYKGLKKLGESSHLFTAPLLFSSFPGRIIKIGAALDKKSRKTLKGSPANVVVRNYPVSADELRKKLGATEGKDEFIYATRLGNLPVMLYGERVNVRNGIRQTGQSDCC